MVYSGRRCELECASSDQVVSKRSIRGTTVVFNLVDAPPYTIYPYPLLHACFASMSADAVDMHLNGMLRNVRQKVGGMKCAYTNLNAATAAGGASSRKALNSLEFSRDNSGKEVRRVSCIHTDDVGTVQDLARGACSSLLDLHLCISREVCSA